MAFESTTLVAGMKRPHSSSTPQQPNKKLKVHRRVRHVQRKPSHVEPAPQDPVFAQGQLLKSIAAGLVTAGYESVQASALEMFRSHVEEYMLEFLSHARASMHGSRRTRPTAQDFAQALAHTPSASTASLLKPQLAFHPPSDISNPVVVEPAPDAPAATDLSNLLQPLMAEKAPPFVPRYFPTLPPQHTWLTTPVVPKREKDARKLREKATEEGTMAEQALRNLAAAEKAGKEKMEQRRTGALLSGFGKARHKGSALSHARHRLREDTLGGLLDDDGIEGEVGM